MKTICGIATIPEREDFLKRVLESIFPQVDKLIICLNNYEKVPDWLNRYLYPDVEWYLSDNKHGDAGKFLKIDDIKEGIYLTIDDDLIYPPGYVHYMKQGLQLTEGSVVSLHGSFFEEFPIHSYYKSKITAPCLETTFMPIHCHIPGTGCMAFDVRKLNVSLQDFPQPNMADIWMGILCQRQMMPCIVLPHPKGYLTYNKDLHLKDTIWGQQAGRDHKQTQAINQYHIERGWRLY